MVSTEMISQEAPLSFVMNSSLMFTAALITVKVNCVLNHLPILLTSKLTGLISKPNW